MAWGGVNLPRQAQCMNRPAWLKCVNERKWRAILSGRYIRQCIWIPLADEPGLTWWNGHLQPRVLSLQGSVAATMIAVKMRVEQSVQRPGAQNRSHQSDRLCGMAAIPAVNQDGLIRVRQQNIVGRQPAALENMQPFRQGRWRNQRGSRHQRLRSRRCHTADRNSRRKILPTLVLGRSSRNSMYLGRL